MAYTEDDFKWFSEHQLKREDTFRFSCKMCGDCCRSRQSPILITGPDLFRIAKSLDKPILDVIREYTRGYIGTASHVPVVVLKERDDGSCRLMRKGKCTIHHDKPVVCALFPLGRYFDARDRQFHYFLQQNTCRNGTETAETWTLQEWLDEFGIEKHDSMAAAWDKMLEAIATVTHRMDETQVQGETMYFLTFIMYVNYDTSKPYEPQVMQNLMYAKAWFKKYLNKNIVIK